MDANIGSAFVSAANIGACVRATGICLFRYSSYSLGEGGLTVRPACLLSPSTPVALRGSTFMSLGFPGSSPGTLATNKKTSTLLTCNTLTGRSPCTNCEPLGHFYRPIGSPHILLLFPSTCSYSSISDIFTSTSCSHYLSSVSSSCFSLPYS